MARRRKSNVPYLILAVMISAVLWGMAHGASTIDQGFDIPVVFEGIPDDLVITDQSARQVNVRVMGSRAALRNVSASQLEYLVRVEGGKPGPAIYEVDATRIELPSGVRPVSRSPASIQVEFERRGRKSVGIRPDLEGEPAQGYRVTGVEVDPPRVWLAGARSDVLRLSEVVTETIPVAGLSEPVEREVRLSLGGGHVWMEEQQPVTVRIAIEPEIQEEEIEEAAEEPAAQGSG